jgi:hypothetical protein
MLGDTPRPPAGSILHFFFSGLLLFTCVGAYDIVDIISLLNYSRCSELGQLLMAMLQPPREYLLVVLA